MDVSRGYRLGDVGGESGPKARPMEIVGGEEIHAMCDDAGVAFFFKQWGGVKKYRTGRESNGQTYDQMPLGLAV